MTDDEIQREYDRAKTDITPATDAQRRKLESLMLDIPIPTQHAIKDFVYAALRSEREQAVRECAEKAKQWLEDWGGDLGSTSDAYYEAAKSGKFNGRSIDLVFAKTCARQFKERSNAVYDSGDLVSKHLLTLIDRGSK